MKTRITAAVIVASAVACEPDAGTPGQPGVQQRDSAGIRIVENPRPPHGSRLGWRIDPEPTVSIGVLEGDEAHLLFQAFDAVRLADGRIVIANRSSAELRIFDSDGDHLATRGGIGEGPGEFADLWRVERWPGDSVVAWWAPGPGEPISVFDADGNYGRTFRLEDVGVMFSPSFATTDGSILVQRIPEGGDTAVFQLRDGEGRFRSSLGTHPGGEPYRMTVDGQRQLSSKIFGRDPVWTTWGDLVAIGHTGLYEIKAFRANGSLERIVRLDHVPRPPTPADVEANILSRMGGTRGMSDAEAERYRVEWLSRYENVPVAQHLPAFKSIMTDAVGHLWVEEYESPTDEFPMRLWTVFDPEGRVLGFFETPKDWRIYDIGEDYILVRILDELAVESVHLWRLDRSTGQEGEPER